GDALVNVEPAADPDPAAFDADRDLRRQRLGERGRVPRIVELDLSPAVVDLLAEVAVAADERYGDQRQIEIGRGAERVAREHAQAAAVSRDLRAERDLHREVADAAAIEERRQRARGQHLGALRVGETLAAADEGDILVSASASRSARRGLVGTRA